MLERLGRAYRVSSKARVTVAHALPCLSCPVAWVETESLMIYSPFSPRKINKAGKSRSSSGTEYGRIRHVTSMIHHRTNISSRLVSFPFFFSCDPQELTFANRIWQHFLAPFSGRMTFLKRALVAEPGYAPCLMESLASRLVKDKASTECACVGRAESDHSGKPVIMSHPRPGIRRRKRKEGF